jgi:hypothetical protein
MDQIVASLMLGFWAAMLKREYNKPIWDHEVSERLPAFGWFDSRRERRRKCHSGFAKPHLSS